MIHWYWLLLPVVAAVVLYLDLVRVAGQRDDIANSLKLVEMEYRLMSQNVALFGAVEAQQAEVVDLIKKEFGVQ